jgi:hypothetical protein
MGAGFSFGTGHEVERGNFALTMPLQNNLFEILFKFHFQSIKTLDPVAQVVRKYFSPNSFRPTRGGGANRHADLKNLSVEEVVTFLEEMVRDLPDSDSDEFRRTEATLRQLTIELFSYLSSEGSPNQNPVLRAFRNTLLDTDTVVTFNWDTLLDNVLSKGNKWHPAWGYGLSVRKVFKYAGSKTRNPPKKHPTLFKLHGSITTRSII